MSRRGEMLLVERDVCMNRGMLGRGGCFPGGVVGASVVCAGGRGAHDACALRFGRWRRARALAKIKFSLLSFPGVRSEGARFDRKRA